MGDKESQQLCENVTYIAAQHVQQQDLPPYNAVLKERVLRSARKTDIEQTGWVPSIGDDIARSRVNRWDGGILFWVGGQTLVSDLHNVVGV